MRSKKGNLLVELIVVLAIIALSIGVVLVSVHSYNPMLVYAEVQKLHSICHYLRARAITTGNEQRITFFESKGSYEYGEVKDGLAKGVMFGAPPHAKGPPSQPTHALESPITFVDKVILFYPDGTIAAGTVYLTDIHRRCGYALSSPISSFSYLRIYKYHRATWEKCS